MKIVTIFKDIFEKDTPFYRSAEAVFGWIRDGKYENEIHRIRHEQDSKQRSKLKERLPSICFSGEFKTRHDSQIVKHSGLVVLDFDHIDISFKEKIIQDPYTFAAFISPSGDGLKVLVRIPPEIENHEAYYMGILKYCEDNDYPKLDTTSRNLSRVCYISYDPDLYLNPDSEVFKEMVRDEKPKGRNLQRRAQRTDYTKMDVACGMIRNSADGEKHHQLVRAARLVGGFIAGGLVEEPEAIRILELEINQKDPDDFKKAQKTIFDGIEFGKRDPIVDENYSEKLKESRDSEVIIEDEPAKSVVFLDEPVRAKVVYSFEHGTSKGETTHFPLIDQVYRMKRGEVTLMHGIGNHGKSAMIMQLMLAKSVYDGYKWGIFSPENRPEEEFYKDLIHSYVGKSTEPYHENQMSREELEAGMDFVSDHFFLVQPKDVAPTPKYINSCFRELVIKNGIDGCAIDPYNQLDNDISRVGGREDQYISRFLTDCKRFAGDHDLFYYIVAHPKGGLTKSGGNYDMPDVYDLSGGAMWNNKLDNILCYHRPNFSTDRMDPSAIFASQKIKKQKSNGFPGNVDLFFSRAENRFRQQLDNYNPLDKVSEGIQQDIWEDSSRALF